MSVRTIIVGILAAFCGVCATVGVIAFQIPSKTTEIATTRVLVAKITIETGETIEENMLDSMEWYSNQLPSGVQLDQSNVIGKFAVSTITAGDLIVTTKFAAEPTSLLPARGKFAFAIETNTASSNVGRNLTVGNRVDVLWTTTNGAATDSGKPIACRLLQNVKILAIGQAKGDLDDAQKSITLEVLPKMDENLSYAQVYGKLTLALRNPGDDDGVEPYEVTNLRTLMTTYLDNKNAPKQDAPPSALETSFGNLLSRFAILENSLKQPADKPDPIREAVNRIRKGMRAITIETPDESTALAGLLEPGDRIDLVLTVSRVDTQFRGRESVDEALQIPSETLIKNVEILAVDTKLQTVEGDSEKKKSRSVTVIIKDEMKHDIARAMKMGTLTLVLRGKDENDGDMPETVMSVKQFVSRHLAIPEPSERGLVATAIVPRASVNRIRTLRGGAVQEIPVSIESSRH